MKSTAAAGYDLPVAVSFKQSRARGKVIVTTGVQRVMLCRCGNPKILALGLCPTCYTLRRQDDAYYGGLREAVLDRDDRRCRTCPNLKRQKPAVHHRVPGISKLELMITLCLGCHAKVTRTQFLQDDWPELLRILGESSTRKGMNR
jgi:hypothetical protein